MGRMLTYGDAVSVLEQALAFGIDPSLEPIERMCSAMGDPQRSFECVQVAGSNGKSSTSRMTAALLAGHGRHVGLYTSPHLIAYPERIEIDGEVVDEELFAAGIATALDAVDAAGVEATEFELLTAAALWVFAQQGVEVAVLECGLGGRWDATTVADARVAVITGIALEHTQILGDTVDKIAAEKAAIIKPGAVAVLASGVAAREVFERQAQKVGARIADVDSHAADPYAAALAHLPHYQRANAATALTAVAELLGHPVDRELGAEALGSVVVPGRFEVLRADPPLIIDAAHNPQSAQVLAAELQERFAADARPMPTLLLGVLADKDACGIVAALAPLFDDIVVTSSDCPRALPADELACVVEGATGTAPRVAATVPEALGMLHGVPALVTGSITVAGEVKRIWC